MTDAMNLFDRRAVRAHRDRAAAGFDGFDFLLREVAERLADRLADVKRRFPLALDLGCHTGQAAGSLHGRGGIETLLQCDPSPAMAARAGRTGAGPAVAADLDALPFREGAFDLAISVLSLHWVSDLPGALLQVRRALRPDGLFLGALLGGETLTELRQCLMAAEIEIRDGIGPRVSPFAEVRDCGALLQRAGFALPVTDCDRITVTYDNAFKLMAELRGMGEGNALAERPRGGASRRLFLRTAELYTERFAGPDGRIPATFDIVYLHGWAPHDSQPRPLRPGSAAARLADALDAIEVSTGVKPDHQGRA